MPHSHASLYHPKRWTLLTWLAVLVWGWYAIPLNYPPSTSYTVDPFTGELSDPTHYKSLADIPVPVGWPVQYVTPSPGYRMGGVFRGGKAVWLPPPIPRARVSPAAMIADFVLIVSAIAALIYVLQKTKHRFSLLFLIGCMSAYPLYIRLARLVALVGGHRAVEWYTIAVYFSPIPIAIAVKWSLFPSWNWRRFSAKWKAWTHRSDDHDDPENAIAAAARLEKRGDWEAAIESYRRAAERWPEHMHYAQQCINRVAERNSLGKPSVG